LFSFRKRNPKAKKRKKKKLAKKTKQKTKNKKLFEGNDGTHHKTTHEITPQNYSISLTATLVPWQLWTSPNLIFLF
jgi:hypothetical protein